MLLEGAYTTDLRRQLSTFENCEQMRAELCVENALFVELELLTFKRFPNGSRES